MWLGELSNAGTPVAGMTDTGSGTGVGYSAMTVSVAGSWAAIASHSDGNQTNSVGLGTFNAGPLQSGYGQVAGLTYGSASSNTPAATGWTQVGGPWCTAGIVVPPA